MSRWRPGSTKKTIGLRQHAKRRAFERYSLTLNTSDLKALGDEIRAERAKFIKRRSHTRSVWEVVCKGITCQVVYDNNRKTVVTFLEINKPAEPQKGKSNEHDQRNTST